MSFNYDNIGPAQQYCYTCMKKQYISRYVSSSYLLKRSFKQDSTHLWYSKDTHPYQTSALVTVNYPRKTQSPFIIFFGEDDFRFRCKYCLAVEYQEECLRRRKLYKVQRPDPVQILLNRLHPYYKDPDWQMQFEIFTMKVEEYKSGLYHLQKELDKYNLEIRSENTLQERIVTELATARALNEDLHLFKPPVPYFDRFDIVEARSVWYYTHLGIFKEPIRWATLKLIKFSLRTELIFREEWKNYKEHKEEIDSYRQKAYDALTLNGKTIFDKLCSERDCDGIVCKGVDGLYAPETQAN